MVKRILIGTVLVMALASGISSWTGLPIPVVQPVIKAVQCQLAVTSDCSNYVEDAK